MKKDVLQWGYPKRKIAEHYLRTSLGGFLCDTVVA